MEIQKKILSICDRELLSGVWTIYENSFPQSEMRTLSNLRDVMQGEHCKIAAYHVNGDVIGFIVYWEYSSFVYVEFFAVSNLKRNGGYGSYIIRDFIEDFKSKPIILEIDNICDDISKRRHGFYVREGFLLNDFKHAPTAYNDINDTLNLHIMTYQQLISQEQYDEFYNILVSDILSNLYC